MRDRRGPENSEGRERERKREREREREGGREGGREEKQRYAGLGARVTPMGVATASRASAREFPFNAAARRVTAR